MRFLIVIACVASALAQDSTPKLSDSQRAAWWRAAAEAQAAQRQSERATAKLQNLRGALCGDHAHLGEDSQGEPTCIPDPAAKAK